MADDKVGSNVSQYNTNMQNYTFGGKTKLDSANKLSKVINKRMIATDIDTNGSYIDMKSSKAIERIGSAAYSKR